MPKTLPKQLDSRLELSVDGNALDLTNFEFRESLDSPCSSFSATVVHDASMSLVGKDCVLRLGPRCVEARIEGLTMEIGADRRQAVISGRDHVSLLVDSCAEPVEFAGEQDFADVASKLAEPFGISIKADTKRPIKDWAVTEGQSVYQALEAAARTLGVHFVPSDGRTLTITDATSTATATIDMTTPILSISARRDISGLYGAYVAQGSTLSFNGSAPQGTVTDPDIDPRRRLVIATTGPPKPRAEMERRIRRMRSEEITLTIPGTANYALAQGITLDLFGLRGTYIVKSRTTSLEVGDTSHFTTKIQLTPEIS